MLRLPLRILDRLEEILIASLMAAATLITFAAVVHRYLSTVPGIQDYATEIDMTWAQELCIYMFIWVAKFGAAYGVRTGIHVGVDVLVNRLPPTTRGVVVTNVADGSPASVAGLERGDVIQEIDHVRITSVGDYNRAVGRAMGHTMLLLVNRQGNTRYIAVEPQ